jgi:hypothetical protein
MRCPFLAAHDSKGAIIMLRHPTTGRAASHGRKSSKQIRHVNSTMRELGSPVRTPLTRQQLAVLQQKRRKARIT